MTTQEKYNNKICETNSRPAKYKSILTFINIKIQKQNMLNHVNQAQAQAHHPPQTTSVNEYTALHAPSFAKI